MTKCARYTTITHTETCGGIHSSVALAPEEVSDSGRLQLVA